MTPPFELWLNIDSESWENGKGDSEADKDGCAVMPRLFGRVTDPPQDALPFTPGCSIPYSAVWTASVVLDVEFEESGLWAEVE